MAKHGIVEFVRGLNRIGVKPSASLATNYDITLPPALPSGTQGVQRDATGVESYFTPVTALNLSTEANALLASSVAAGAFTLDLDTQTANLILASPTTGGAAKPTFRNLVVGDFGATPPTLNAWGAPTTTLSLNNQKIGLLADPTAAQEAATKAYVDALIQGFVVKIVKVAANANITLLGLQTVDGVSLAAGDRVLLKNQTTASENGIYVVAAGAWVRSTDLDAQTELVSAMMVLVEQGTQNNDTSWLLSTDGLLTLGTSSLNFIQFNGLAQVIDGAGLTKTGNQLDVGGNAGRIVVNANDIDLATVGTPGTYSSVSVDAYGRVTAGTTPTTTKVFRQTFTSATLSAGILTVTHNIGNQYCQPTVWDNNNKIIGADDYNATSTTAMTVDLTSYGAITGTWNVVIIG